MSSRTIEELCLNFVERMRHANMHNLANIQIDKRQRREERMIEFFTGAYVALRHAGETRKSQAVGQFTSLILAKHGYPACCREAGVKFEHTDKVILHG